MDAIISLAPILLLIWLMAGTRMPSNRALPLSAAVVYLIQLLYFSRGFRLLHAAVLDGLLTAATPVLIVFGAIFLFRTMEATGAMEIIRAWLNQITRNRVGQLMIVGWSFSFLIEGVSGFGTPAALAAPLLVGLGFPALPTAVFCLVMNTVPVSFGAVGMPAWFGFSQLALTEVELLELGFRTALLHSAAAWVVPLVALPLMVDAREIRRNLLFIYLSVFASVIPYVLLAKWNYEFPAVLGGFIGLVISVFLARASVGMEKPATGQASEGFSRRRLALALFPLWGTVLVLLVTRVQAFGLRAWLTATTPLWEVSLGPLGEFLVSPSLVFQLENIFGTEMRWSHATFYVPSLLPFLFISVLSWFVVPRSGHDGFTQRGRAWHHLAKTGKETLGQIKKPLGAFLGALVFVKLFMVGGETSSAALVGNALASLTGRHWQHVSVFLGALGSFFSGSNTVSNLTFGGIQNSISESLGLDRLTILALQSVGGAMGNMVCIHNIVAVCAILGLRDQEGEILKRTFVPMMIYGVLVTIAALLF
jgi:lactate permease